MTTSNAPGVIPTCEPDRLSVLLVLSDPALKPSAIDELIQDFDFREPGDGPSVPQALIGPRPHLILACCARADSAAFELCRQIKAWDGARGIPLLLAVGGCFDDVHAQAALQSGADDIVDIAGLPSLARTRIRLLASQGRRAQEGLSRLASIVESSDDAIISCTTDGRITSWNSGAEKTYGYSAAEAMGRSISFMIPPDRPNDTLLILDNITRPQSVHNYEVLHVKRDGKVIIVSLTVSPIRDAAGWVIGASLIARDVTGSRQLQEELRQAQKMDAIGRLAGGIAHDFNNLLTAINGYSDLTLKTLAKGDPVYENIAEIRKSGERAASLTRQLLAFGSKQLLQPRILDLNVIITDMNKLLRRLIGEHIELVTNTMPGLGAVKADPGQIEQIIVNLAVNARDAMHEGGTLTIHTGNVLEAERGQVAAPDGAIRPWAFIKVSDTGCGMDPVTLSRIFEPFFSTKGQGKGSGLGLSTVYGIVKQSGGHIVAESAVGCGSCFTIYLPLLETQQGASLAGSKISAQPDGWETILLIEDEDTVRHLASHVLRMHGYRVLEARHAGEALKIAEGHDDAIHLMLTDVVMPKMNGRQLAESLAPLRPGMKVIYMSGYNDDIILNAGLGPHIAFLQKPFPPDLLVQKVRRVLDSTTTPALR